MVLSQKDMRSYILMTWMSASTNRAGTVEAGTAIISLIVPTAPLFLMTRWFDRPPAAKARRDLSDSLVAL
ncbi:hypothetical protein [Rhizobium sp. YTU87027]|uniref:hypothetical protein n=1 Tax=Rhizobium sp. YTU87027 TaxID=3417741 RepID=UPI003D693241